MTTETMTEKMTETMTAIGVGIENAHLEIFWRALIILIIGNCADF